MNITINKNKFSHEFLHFITSISTLGVCAVWIQNPENWEQIGKLTNNLLRVLFLQECFKVILVLMYGNYEETESVSLLDIAKNIIKGTRFWGILTVHVFSIIIYTCFCMALGAPQIEKIEETFVIAFLLTILTVTPIVLMFGIEGFLDVIFGESFETQPKLASLTALNLVKYNAIGAIIGAWFGSALIFGYGWIKNWFTYPIPNVFGMILGSLICNICGLLQILYQAGMEKWNSRCLHTLDKH